MRKSPFSNLLYLMVITAMIVLDIIDLRNMTIYIDAQKSSLIAIAVLFVVLTLSCVVFQWGKKNDSFSISYFVLIGYIYFISLIHSVSVPIGTVTYLTMVMPLMMFVTSRASVTCVNPRLQQLCFIISFLILGYCYFSYRSVTMESDVMEYYHNNSSYFLLYLFPLLLSNPKSIIKWGSILITAAVVFSSTKRGGSIAFLFAVVAFVYTRFFVMANKRNRLVDILAVIVLLVVFAYVISSFWGASIDVLLDRLWDNNDEGERGRMTIYQTVITMILTSSPIDLWFGHGWNQVISDNPIGLSAHNDFLECIYDFGIIGLLLFIWFFYHLISYTIRLVKTRSQVSPPMAAATAIFFVNSMVSHILIYPTFAMIFMLVFGYFSGMETIESANEASNHNIRLL